MACAAGLGITPDRTPSKDVKSNINHIPTPLAKAVGGSQDGRNRICAPRLITTTKDQGVMMLMPPSETFAHTSSSSAEATMRQRQHAWKERVTPERCVAHNGLGEN